MSRERGGIRDAFAAVSLEQAVQSEGKSWRAGRSRECWRWLLWKRRADGDGGRITNMKGAGSWHGAWAWQLSGRAAKV